MQYNKLVRDKIPDIITAAGKKCSFMVLDQDAYIDFLDKKLCEELAEYQESGSLEELADLLEVIRATTIARGYTLEELEKIRAKKAEERGGFSNRILLKEVFPSD